MSYDFLLSGNGNSRLFRAGLGRTGPAVCNPQGVGRGSPLRRGSRRLTKSAVSFVNSVRFVNFVRNWPCGSEPYSFFSRVLTKFMRCTIFTEARFPPEPHL